MPRQDSLADQMHDVMKYAVQVGAYDAHDWLQHNFESPAKTPDVPNLSDDYCECCDPDVDHCHNRR